MEYSRRCKSTWTNYYGCTWTLWVKFHPSRSYRYFLRMRKSHKNFTLIQFYRKVLHWNSSKRSQLLDQAGANNMKINIEGKKIFIEHVQSAVRVTWERLQMKSLVIRQRTWEQTFVGLNEYEISSAESASLYSNVLRFSCRGKIENLVHFPETGNIRCG